jgi:hypothetical protein
VAVRTATLSASGGTMILGSAQHLANVDVTGGRIYAGTGKVNTIFTTGLSVSVGTLDLGGAPNLGGNSMFVNYGSGASPAQAIRGMIANAANAGPAWSANGITTSLAIAQPAKYAIGYADGNSQSAQDAGIGVAPGQVLVRPVLTGDVNMDGTVDFNDIIQILGYKYNINSTASYSEGDIDYSGKTDFNDIIYVLSANYNTGQTFGPSHAKGAAVLAATSATPTLTGVTSASAVASATTIGTTGDGKPDFEYNSLTGDLRFKFDGANFTTTGGAASFVGTISITSLSGRFLAQGVSAAFAGGAGAIVTSTVLSSALATSPGFTDGFDIGNVLPVGLALTDLTGDLTVKYQVVNGGILKNSDITPAVPEPTGLGRGGIAGAAAAPPQPHPPKRLMFSGGPEGQPSRADDHRARNAATFGTHPENCAKFLPQMACVQLKHIGRIHGVQNVVCRHSVAPGAVGTASSPPRPGFLNHFIPAVWHSSNKLPRTIRPSAGFFHWNVRTRWSPAAVGAARRL